LFRNVAEQRVKILDGFRPEVDLVPLQRAHSPTGRPYLARKSLKT
jgi:hypothetical protein